jgi:hypothetical protein
MEGRHCAPNVLPLSQKTGQQGLCIVSALGIPQCARGDNGKTVILEKLENMEVGKSGRRGFLAWAREEITFS